MPDADNPNTLTNVELKTSKPRRPPRIWVAVLATPLLAVGFAVAIFVVGGPVGGYIFEQDPAYWYDEIYGWDINEHPEARTKVAIQTALRFSIPAAIVGFLIGLLLPWVRYFWLLQRHLTSTDGG